MEVPDLIQFIIIKKINYFIAQRGAVAKVAERLLEHQLLFCAQKKKSRLRRTCHSWYNKL